MFSISKRDRTLSSGKKAKEKDAYPDRKTPKTIPFELAITAADTMHTVPAALPAHVPTSNAMPFMLGSGSSSKVLYQLGAPVTLSAPSGASPRKGGPMANGTVSIDDIDLDEEEDLHIRKSSQRVNGHIQEEQQHSQPRSHVIHNLRRGSQSTLNMRRRSSLPQIPDMSPTAPQTSNFPELRISTSPPQSVGPKQPSPLHTTSPLRRRLSAQLSSTDSLPTSSSRHAESSSSSLASTLTSTTTAPTSLNGTTSRNNFVFNPNYSLKGNSTSNLNSKSSSSSLHSKISSNGKTSVRTYRHPVSAEPKGSPIPSIGDSAAKTIKISTSSPNMSAAASRRLGSQSKEPEQNLDQQAEPTEEIVPWMFDSPTKKAFPQEQPSRLSPRTRQTSQMSVNDDIDRLPRASQNSVALARTSSRNSDESNLRKTSATKSFFGMLRRKVSRADLDTSANETDRRLSNENTKDQSTGVSNMTTPRKSVISLTSRSRKQSSRDRGRSKSVGKAEGSQAHSERPAAAAAAATAALTGITLDTDMDRMEGIVSMDSIHAAQVNGVPTYLNDTAVAYPRPRTPDSYSTQAQSFQQQQRRRPSMAQSLLGTLDSDIGSGGGDSPLSSRSILSSRRPSFAPEAIIWNSSFGGNTAGAAQFAGRPLSANPPSTIASAHSQITNDARHSADNRKISAGMQGAAAANEASRAAAAHAAQLASLNTTASEAGWIAPESWAVEENVDGDNDADRSDEDAHSVNSPQPGHLLGPGSPLLPSDDDRRESMRPGSISGGVMYGEVVRPLSSKDKGAGRPGTSGSLNLSFTNDRAAQFTIRVFKPDGSHTTIIAPFLQTVADIQHTVARKPGFVKTKGAHRLFVQEKGVERPMAGNERPIRLQQLRLEQAGYTEWDSPEDLGREDHSYLIKFVYKPDVVHRAGLDDLQISSFEYVDLRGRSLTTIPIFLYNHAHDVVSLYLSRNPKLDLPADFVQLCTALRELRLSETAIKRIPQSIRHAAGLTRLDISNNRILDLDHIRLDELAELTRLDVFNNRLFALPNYFAQFKALKYLIVSNNKFEVFPTIVCQISSLVELDMSFNLLTTLPDEIGQLRSLERLCLTGNGITGLPPTFNRLSSLRELDIRNNSIDDLAILDQLPCLTSVQIEHNKCTTLAFHLVSLKKLRAVYNPLTKFGPTGTGHTLTCLNLSNAKLTALDDSMFSNLAALDNLYLDHNSIRVLPDSVCTLANLTTLSCRYNKLESLPENIGRLASLQILNVSNNDLHSLPPSVWQLTELGTLNASSNLLTEFPDPPTISLTQPITHVMSTVEDGTASASLRNDIMPLHSAGPNTGPLVAVLEHLYLADNRLPDEVFHPISLLTELKVLNLSFNEIFEIPHRTLAKNSQLESLYLSGNKLTTLPEDDFEKLFDLKVLHLNGNKLNTLPAELGTLKKLQALDVGSNMLKYNIANWKYDWNWNWNLELRYLNLSGNKRLEIKPAGPQVQPHDVASIKRRNLSDFTALRKVRTLGLMDVTLTIPAIPDDNEERRVRTSLSKVNDMGYGIADTLGLSDNLNVIDLVVPRFRGKDDECLLGIFDGQSCVSSSTPSTLSNNPPGSSAGQNASSVRLPRYLQESFSNQLHLEMNRMIEGEADVSDVLRRAFVNLNREYGNSLLATAQNQPFAHNHPGAALANQNSIRNGASGVVAYVSQKVMYVANVGQAQAVLAGRNGQARSLALKHDPLERQEYLRIRAAEGWISNKGLVNDDVPLSRSFGHYHLFPAVNASPSIQVIELSELDELVILANAGIWDYIDHQTAVDIARGERSDPMMAAQKLRDLAIAYGSTAHIMVMVVSVADLFKTKTAPNKRRGGLAAESAAGYALAKAQAQATRGNRNNLEVLPTERYLSMVDREIPAPTGTVAIIFTDIRNSTSLWESDANMHVAVRLHNQIMRRQLRSIGGYEVKTEGDAFMCSFPSVPSAVLWAFTTQLELMRGDWPQSILDSDEGMEITSPSDPGTLIYRGLCVRMGIHWGQPHCEADPITRRMDYFGPMVNRSARISAVADGGQIAVSSEVIDIIKRLCGDRRSSAGRLENGQTAEDADEEEDEDELDEATKRDITAIRNMGVCITELGERKLKGLETSDVLSLIYPTALAGRLKFASNTGLAPTPMISLSAALAGSIPATADAGAIETIAEPVPHLLDVLQMQELGVTTMRLESAVSVQMHPPLPVPLALTASSPSLSLRSTRRKVSLHPHMTEYPLRLDATDEELMAVLEGFVIRVENVVNTLTLHQLGPYTDVLAALGSITRNDPRMLLNALSAFAGAMGQNRL